MAHPPPPSPQSPAKRPQKHLFTFLKVAIAILGLWYVGRSLTWNDTAVLAANAEPINTVSFVDDTRVTVLGTTALPGGKIIVRIRFPETPVKVRIDYPFDGKRDVEIVLADDALIPGTTEHLGIKHEMDVGFDRLKEQKADPQAKGEYIHPGMRTLLKTAGGKWPLLLAAWALLVIPFFVTAIRWRNLMRPQGLNMPLGKCVQLTFVGQFYSIMLPGITGGDLVKIVYAARLTGSKTKSFITIILDRVIGLVALMVIAGTSAGVQLFLNHRAGVVSDNTLVNVFILIVALLAALALGATVYFSRRLRKSLGIEWFIEHLGSAAEEGEEGRAKLEHLFRVLNGLILLAAALVIAALAVLRWSVHLPWAEHNTPVIYAGIGGMGLAALAAAGGLLLHSLLIARTLPLISKLAEGVIRVDETLRVYRGHFGLLFWSFVISLISQLTLPLSSWLCGMSLEMTSPVTHYLAYVPVVVLAASMPFSPPQGFGVMDWLLAHFFSSTASPGQAVMLVQGIRFLPMLWNLVGGYWVVTGKYSRAKELQSAGPAENSP